MFSSAASCQPQCWAALHAAVDSCDWWHRTSVVLGGAACCCRLTVGAAPHHSRCHRRGHQSKTFDHRKHSAKAKIGFLCPLPINGVFRLQLDKREYHSQVSQKPAPEKVQEHEGTRKGWWCQGVGPEGERFKPGTSGAGGVTRAGRDSPATCKAVRAKGMG